MNSREVTMVRIYITEGEGLMRRLLAKLHDEERVRGVTVFRGIAGFGRSGKMHSSTLLDLALDLPIVLEFFDEPAKAAAILSHLEQLVPPGHIVTWPAQLHEG